MSLALPDCTPRCRSLRHAEEVVAALTGGSEGRLRAFLTAHCYNAAALRDAFGRTALHLAASLGKRALLEWLLEHRSADLLVKDKESGWTALHRSAFYGHIHCLLALVKHGGSLTTQDKEGLSVLDLTMKDRPSHVVFRSTDPTEVYTWGNNTNFTLGHGNQESRQHPEIVDLFSRTGVYIKQVVLCKFHSVFLSQNGQVFTCGHGQGGRLGHGDEQTYLVPRMVDGLLSHHCSQVAAAKDHTVVLTENGDVYTFGLNTFHQLGLIPPPASSHLPKQVSSKSLKGRTVIGVAAGRFHTVLWTQEAVYTMGLNGGQLGYLLDPNGERCVTAPRQVSALHHKEVSVAMVAASDGATVCVTERGDVYLLTDYQCKKLASRQLNIRKVLVSGGCLDHRVDPQALNEGGGEKVSILALDEAGRVFCWRSANSLVKQCRWAYGRQVFVYDLALSRDHMMFITQEGEGFGGQWLNQSKKSSDRKDTVECLAHSDNVGSFERIRLEKIPHVHRAVGVTMDSIGRSFAVLQSDPKTSLYEIPSVSPSTFSQQFRNLLAEADETDGIHDVALQAGGQVFPAHRFILSSRSDFFRLQLCPEPGGRVDIPRGVDAARRDLLIPHGVDAAGRDLLILEGVSAEALEQVLQFVYTDSCDMLERGFRPKVLGQDRPVDPDQDRPVDPDQDQLICSLQNLGFNEGLKARSALEVYRSLPVSALNGDKRRNKSNRTAKKSEGGANPVKTLQGVAKKLGISSLSARLDGVKYENGVINVVQKKSGNRLKFNQKKCSYLSDVTLRSEDGREFPCHKCVLCARLEYFHSMLGNPWVEATSSTALEMPTCGDVLQVILEYVYTDESPTIRECQNVEFVCNVLVVADQLLVTRLKEMCEVAVTENLTLKNAVELLEFSALYNAQQLKLSCLQFIVLNIAALLESRALDILSVEVQLELSTAYRSMIPAMQKRIITPYPGAPDLSAYQEEDWDSLIYSRDKELEHTCREMLLKKAKMKAKRKPRRRSNSSGGYNLSDIIQSPPAGLLYNCPVLPGEATAGRTNSSESLQELLMSDSEGSCGGGGSPRDMPSPDFHEKPEVKGKGLVRLSVLPQTLDMIDGTSRPLKCSHPPLESPARPPPILDLRAIMEMESNSLNIGATSRSPGSTSKTSPLPVKLSQKQRKIIAMLTKEGGAVNSPPIVTPTKGGKSWAMATLSPPPSRSFRDLLLEEETQLGGAAGDRSPRLGGAVGDGSPRRLARRGAINCPETLETPAGPWVLPVTGSPALGTMVTFASIVEEERQQEAALIRSREKPLALIQIEERAIQDLLLHYKASNNPEELIVVERAAVGPIASPMWNKH